MNCSRTQQLLSPYLDQQLTGAEMLAIQRHLSECILCAEEYQAARQVKALLHSLSLPRAKSSLESRILSRLAQEEHRSEPLLPILAPLSTLPALLQSVPVLTISLPPPNRGRRLTAALALSCLAVFAAAAPFAPSTPSDPVSADRVSLGQTTMLEPMPNAGLHTASADGTSWMHTVSASPAPQSGRDADSVQRDVQPPLIDAGAEPLGDAAASGYVSGDVAFVGYRVH